MSTPVTSRATVGEQRAAVALAARDVEHALARPRSGARTRSGGRARRRSRRPTPGTKRSPVNFEVVGHRAGLVARPRVRRAGKTCNSSRSGRPGPGAPRARGYTCRRDAPPADPDLPRRQRGRERLRDQRPRRARLRPRDRGPPRAGASFRCPPPSRAGSRATPRGRGERTLAITFDDGTDFDWRDLPHPSHGLQRSLFNTLADFRRAGPRRRDAHATAFVVVSRETREHIDRLGLADRGWWTDTWWARRGRERPCRVASHSWDHNHDLAAPLMGRPRATGTFRSIDRFDLAEDEIARASAHLKRVAPNPGDRLFAYPVRRVQRLPRARVLPAAPRAHRRRRRVRRRRAADDRRRRPLGAAALCVRARLAEPREGLEALLRDGRANGARRALARRRARADASRAARGSVALPAHDQVRIGRALVARAQVDALGARLADVAEQRDARRRASRGSGAAGTR